MSATAMITMGIAMAIIWGGLIFAIKRLPKEE